MTDRRTILVVVISMALIALVSIAASAWLLVDGKNAAEILTLAGVAVGSLGSILAHTGSAPPDPGSTVVATSSSSTPVELAPHQGAA